MVAIVVHRWLPNSDSTVKPIFMAWNILVGNKLERGSAVVYVREETPPIQEGK